MPLITDQNMEKPYYQENSDPVYLHTMKQRSLQQNMRKAFVLSFACLTALLSNIDAQVVTGKPDVCIKAEKEGKTCPYCVLEPLKAGALSFKLGYVSLYTRDVPRLYEFYKGVLRLDAKDPREYWKGNNINRYVEVPTQGAVLSFSYQADVNNEKSNILLEFGTPLNLDGEYERIKALGVKMKENSKKKNEFKFYDPDGNLINIYWDPHITMHVTGIPNVNSNVIARMPDCCLKAKNAGTNCEYASELLQVPFPPKAGSQTFKLGYVSLFTRDIPKLYDFYKSVLKVEAKDVKELWSGNNLKSYLEVPTQKAILSFTYRADAETNNNIILLEMECQDNLEREYERMKAMGVKMKEGSKKKNEFKCYDPDGNLINVFHYCLNFYRQIPNSD